MFESAELGHTVDDARYAKEAKKLRGDLLDAQSALLEDGSFPVIVLISGVEGAGKGETVNLLNEWFDPRYVRTRAFGPETEEERMRPPMWRYWQALPSRGRIGMLFGSWYTDPVVNRAFEKTTDAELLASVERIRSFEQMLVDEGAVIVKLWFHLSKKAQKKRFKKLEEDKLTRWRVTPADWKAHERYDTFVTVSERVLRETSTGSAPWIVIDGSDANYRALSAGRTILAAINMGLGRAQNAEKKKNGKHNGASKTSPLISTVDTAGIIRSLTFEERLSKEKYATKVLREQAKLGQLSRSSKMKKHSVVVVFEGMDAAGKGGTIRRITQALDARHYNVIPIAAPTDEERAHPYLWRFWRHLPRHEQFVIYDRSWYGRVLVERVEGFATEAAWSRAYHEINEFEEQLVDSGIIVVKFWLAITQDEQLKRFKERETTRYKQFKITPEDWRNRKKWDDYVTAASDMIDRTSTTIAPWTVLEANDKHLVRIRALETLSKRIEAGL